MNLRRLGSDSGWSSRSAAEGNSSEIDGALFFELENKILFIVLPFQLMQRSTINSIDFQPR
jgi:hypothetical protein